MVIAVHNHVGHAHDVIFANVASHRPCSFKRALEGRVIIGGGTYHINQVRCWKVVFFVGRIISVSVSVTIEGQKLFVSTALSFRFPDNKVGWGRGRAALDVYA